MIQQVGTIQPILNGAAGQLREIEVSYNSTLSLSGKSLFFNPALWLQSYAQAPVLPNTGYNITYPFAAGTYNFNLINSANNQTHRNIDAKLIVTDNRNFTIRLRFIYLTDIDSFINTANIAPITRMLQKGTGQSNVYDQNKLMVWHIGYLSGNTPIVNYTDISMGAGHFNRSLNGGSPLTNWSYVLTQGGQPAQGFSLLQDTRINFVIPSQTPIQNRYYFGILETSQPLPTGTFWDGVRLNYAEIQAGVKNATGIPIPDTAITAQAGMVMVGQNGLASVTIDRNYFNSGQQYRFFLAVQIGNIWQSWISDDLGVSENLPASYGDITVTGEVIESGLEYGNCLNNAIVGTTLSVCFNMDKASYDAALLANGVGLSFDNNIQSVQVIKVNGLPVSNGIPSGTSLSVTIGDSPTDYLACAEVPVLSGDVGSPVYIACIWTFTVQSVNGPYTDTIVAYSRYTAAESEQSVNIEFGGVEINNEPFTGEYICENEAGEIVAWIELPDVCEGYEYSVILHEEGNQDNTYNDCIISVEQVPNGVERLKVTINADCVPVDVVLCLTVNIICESQSESECVECFDYAVNVEVTQLGSGFINYRFDFDFSQFTGFSGAQFEILNFTERRNETSDQPTGSYFFSENYAGPIANVLLTVWAVVEANGCLYELCFLFSFNAQEVGETFEITGNACPGPNGCESVVNFDDPCIEVAPGLELTCDGDGTVTITADNGDIEYNFDGGNTWLPYAAPIEIDPETNQSCSVYARAIIVASEPCGQIEEYAIIDGCCPPIECPALACEPIVTYNEINETLSLAYDCGSEDTPDSVTIEYSIDGGATYQTYVSPIDVTTIEQVLWRIIIDYSVSYPLCDPNGFEFEGVWDKEGAEPGSCDSNPGLTVEVVNGCHIATETGDTFFVEDDTIYFSIDEGQSFNEWNGIPICGVDIVVWKRVVCYTNDCPCDCIAAVSIKRPNDVEIVDCNCITWQVSIQKTGNTLCPLVFGLDDYTIEWHRGTNSGWQPLGYDGNGCVEETSSGLYRLTVIDENGCKRFAYRLHIVCEDCPECELTIEKINEDGFGTYLASLDCPNELSGEWQKWSTADNDWIPVGNANPFTPQEPGLFRFVGTVDGDPNCPVEGSILVCEGVAPFCECYESSVLIANSQNNLFDISVDSNYSLRDNEPLSFNFPYNVSDPAQVLLLEADLEAYYSIGAGECTPTVELINDGTNYTLKIKCINGLETEKIPSFTSWRNNGLLTSVFTVDTDCDCNGQSESISESMSISMSESVSEPCQNNQFFAEVDATLSEWLAEISLGPTLALSNEPGFNFPYDLSDAPSRTQLEQDFEAWVIANGYESCCVDPGLTAALPLMSVVYIGGNDYTITVNCWSENYPDFTTYDLNDGSGVFVKTLESEGFCCFNA